MFNDESFNARNPFAASRAPFRSAHTVENLTGALLKDKASFFLNGYRREIDDNAVIMPRWSTRNFNIKPLSQSRSHPSDLSTQAGASITH